MLEVDTLTDRSLKVPEEYKELAERSRFKR